MMISTTPSELRSLNNLVPIPEHDQATLVKHAAYRVYSVVERNGKQFWTLAGRAQLTPGRTRLDVQLRDGIGNDATLAIVEERPYWSGRSEKRA
jgi:hypothetical protein